MAFLVGQASERQWRERKTIHAVEVSLDGVLSYFVQGERVTIDNVVPYSQSELRQASLDDLDGPPSIDAQWVYEVSPDGQKIYSLLTPVSHHGIWSLLPALIAVALCLITREPLTALLTGVLSGALILGRLDITDAVLIPNLRTESAATVLLLYLWLLGGLLGIWSRTGAAQAFATFMTQHFVRGPRSAKLVAWLLGVLFFQGGTMSTVLVGSTVKPLADEHRVSHEELAYIVDSTASPIASVIAFNAWPAYVQALIYVPGAAFLATEADRIAFFFSSVPFSFYGIFAVCGTLLLSLGFTRLSGPGIRAAASRARATGQLDAPDAKPLRAKELQETHIPAGYQPHVLEFVVPLTVLISIAVGTFVVLGVPKVNWAFAAALMIAALSALARGMSLENVVEGFGDGLKGVVLASVILMLAVTVGAISKEVGAGQYMVDLLGNRIAFWALPVALQALTVVTAFSTGSSWGTYAITFPLAMPLAWIVAQQPEVANAELYMMVCFAAVLNGSVYGDQCSPISDTTILSSMSTGCDLMDHVTTQIVPATFAAVMAGVLWTAIVLLFA
ncbi:MAG: Na+/H+ antiporter NhaC family protein [Pseudomonadota bacterium]